MAILFLIPKHDRQSKEFDMVQFIPQRNPIIHNIPQVFWRFIPSQGFFDTKPNNSSSVTVEENMFTSFLYPTQTTVPVAFPVSSF